MGCLNINTSVKVNNNKLQVKLLNKFNCNCILLNTILNVFVSLINHLFIKVTATITSLKLKVTSKNGLTLRTGLVCSLDEFRKLEVSPDSIYLYKGNNYTEYIIIESNVNWTIQ